MFGRKRQTEARTGGFLMRLLRDTRGNALVIMTAALIPLAGMVGGGIDISRMYILKTRLQHACDAGALAGRKTMGAGTWAYNDHYARKQAYQFFDGNFRWDKTSREGSYGSSEIARDFTEAAGKVSGTASATITMTLMRILGRTTEDIAVTCSSEMRLPNTDVMFVLDTTGSMAQQQPGDTVDKMSALKTAVKCFYEIVARLDTNATCTTGTPSGGTGDQVQIRFGFVPYATNVNVGKLLPTEWFANSANYQTREATYNTSTSNSSTTPSVTSTSYTNINDSDNWSTDSYEGNSTQNKCDAKPKPNNGDFQTTGGESGQQGYNAGSGNPRTATWYTTQTGWYYEYRYSFNNNNNRCRLQSRQVYATLRRDYSQTFTTTTTQTFTGWRYASLPVDISLLKSGTSWNTSFQWPTGGNGANATISWDGCIEERATVRETSYDPIPSGASDLDIDGVPSSDSTRWKPALPGLIYTRGDTNYGFNTPEWIYDPVSTTTNYHLASQYFCPTEARKLQTWGTPSAFDSYVDSLSPSGNTYHDIGLIWGARFLSPTGLFASENAKASSGGDIERHMIFMTDGDACAQPYDYTAYGLAWFDRRTTSQSAAPSGGCTYNSATLVEQVNKRTEGLCKVIKNKNITLWVIAFGELATETETRLSNCATSGRYFKATNAAQLQATFKTIADQISMLRLTK